MLKDWGTRGREFKSRRSDQLRAVWPKYPTRDMQMQRRQRPTQPGLAATVLSGAIDVCLSKSLS
jgi:hypothetical protein